MGFELSCFFAVDSEVLPLYERLIPGGSAWVVPTHDDGLPDGWVLPVPWDLELTLDGAVKETEQWVESTAIDAWRLAAGIPGEPDPLNALDHSILRCASLLSLATPHGVVYIDDRTFGGVLINEYAAVCVAGRLHAAYGIDFGDPHLDDARAFELRDGRYHDTDADELEPVADCAAILDQRFSDAFLFDGYLPRDAFSQTFSDPGPRVTAQPTLDPGLVNAWAPYFPILGW